MTRVYNNIKYSVHFMTLQLGSTVHKYYISGKFNIICFMCCNYNYPHTPTNAHNLYTITKHPHTVVLRNSPVHEKHQHIAQGLDPFVSKTLILQACMHITTHNMNSGTSMKFIQECTSIIPPTVSTFLIFIAAIIFSIVYVTWLY
jgi:hypothetical protein